MPARKTRTFRPNGRFYIFLVAVIAAAIIIVVLLTAVDTVKTENGKISFETTKEAVVVRDEEVFNAENYGKATFIASEGERVVEGTPVAEIYKLGYNDKVMSDLLDVQTKIGQYQEHNLLADVIDQDLAAINTDIESKSEEIKNIINGSLDGNLLTAENELKQLMKDKQAYLKEKVNADAQLEEYYTQESQLLERVDSWQETVAAPGTGVVSFYFDGCEDLMNAGNIEQLTIKNINDIINGSSLTQVTSAEAQRPLYRLVNNNKWYLLIVSTAQVPEFALGNEFVIAFDEYLDKQYSGTVVGVREEESGFVYAFELNDDIGPLLNTRRTSAKIYTTFEGITVPSGSIKTVEGIRGIYKVDADGAKTFMPVTVLIEKDGFAVIKPANEGDTVSAGQEIEA